jgi:NhaC family Na+:H+ antiporter
MVAGAIVSGSFFGDKMSPMSDTTNLAPAMAGTDLFTHIRHMVLTTGPAIIIAVCAFTVLGFFYGKGAGDIQSLNQIMLVMDKHFYISSCLFLVPLLLILMVAKKLPALPAMCVGILLGILATLFFQTELLSKMSPADLSGRSIYTIIMEVAHSGFSINTGNTVIDSLFNRGGMSSMLPTVWLIMMAMVFGGAMESVGILEKLAGLLMNFVHGTGTLIGATLGTCIFFNMTASDQYLAIVVPGRMFRKAFEDMKLHPKNLSRALEDSATVTSVLVPWNTCGAYVSSVLGVSTLTYLPFCFFNLLSPLVSSIYGATGFTIEKLQEESDKSSEQAAA